MRPRLLLWSRALAVALYLTGAAWFTALVLYVAEASWPQSENAGAWALAALFAGTTLDLLAELLSSRR